MANDRTRATRAKRRMFYLLRRPMAIYRRRLIAYMCLESHRMAHNRF
nr:MAG TPA: hypothetical protein [Caudoviricetes sp.]